VITASGYVGIGVTGPSTHLHVNGTASINYDIKVSGNTMGSNEQGINTNALVQAALLFLSNNC
jgi:hypothetical protein